METSTGKRSFVKAVLALPIIASIAKVCLFADDVPGDSHSPEFLQKFLAVRILRLLNTAERWHFEANGRYVDVRELCTSEAMDRLLHNAKIDKGGSGRTLYSTLKFENSEVVPGWKFELRIAEDGQSYLATLRDVSGRSLGAFASDQIGVIHEGESLDTRASSGQALAAAETVVIARMAPATNGHFRRVGLMLKALAFGPSVAYAGCCTEYSCDPCGCCEAHGGPGCYNCGCSGCPWSCCK